MVPPAAGGWAWLASGSRNKVRRNDVADSRARQAYGEEIMEEKWRTRFAFMVGLKTPSAITAKRHRLRAALRHRAGQRARGWLCTRLHRVKRRGGGTCGRIDPDAVDVGCGRVRRQPALVAFEQAHQLIDRRGANPRMVVKDPAKTAIARAMIERHQ